LSSLARNRQRNKVARTQSDSTDGSKDMIPGRILKLTHQGLISITAVFSGK